MNNTFNLSDSQLGKSTAPSSNYDPSLLFRIPRDENRTRYEISSLQLPFIGYDVWHCYELSFLLSNGLPICAVVKIIYSCQSSYIVESKSLKLYLNSFNMSTFGDNRHEALKRVAQVIRMDLEQLLQTEIYLSLLDEYIDEQSPFPSYRECELTKQLNPSELEKIKFYHFNETPSLLNGQKSEASQTIKFTTDVLRSNCRVTSQPDWGNLFIFMESHFDVDRLSLLQYIVSFRSENHFHEEVVEMIYKRLWDRFQPNTLMVAAMYTRRGGIDINPIRASHLELIDTVLINPNCRTSKSLRQ